MGLERRLRKPCTMIQCKAEANLPLTDLSMPTCPWLLCPQPEQASFPQNVILSFSTVEEHWLGGENKDLVKREKKVFGVNDID